MEYRFGHIANSSSTSFLIPCKKIPKNIQQIKDLVYGRGSKQEKYHIEKRYIPDMVHKPVFSPHEVCLAIKMAIEAFQNRLNEESLESILINEIRIDLDPTKYEYCTYNKFGVKSVKMDYERYEKDTRRLQEQKAKELLKQYSYFMILAFGNDCHHENFSDLSWHLERSEFLQKKLGAIKLGEFH